MHAQLQQLCEEHTDPYECPDYLVAYIANREEYGLIIHDGGTSYITIDFCPWCGSKLPVPLSE